MSLSISNSRAAKLPAWVYFINISNFPFSQNKTVGTIWADNYVTVKVQSMLNKTKYVFPHLCRLNILSRFWSSQSKFFTKHCSFTSSLLVEELHQNTILSVNAHQREDFAEYFQCLINCRHLKKLLCILQYCQLKHSEITGELSIIIIILK